MGFLTGSRAQEWTRGYRKAMATYPYYVSWSHYKRRLQRDCRTAEDDIDAARKMGAVKYGGSVYNYVSRMKQLDRQAALALLTLKEMVRKALPEPMIRMFPIYGDMSTIAGL